MGQCWDPIYAGNGDPAEVAATFLTVHRRHLVQGEELGELPLNGALLRKAFARNKHTSGGADGWLPSELQVAPLVAC
eukprot:1741939-Alexandrium_andersonii.AAC.1